MGGAAKGGKGNDEGLPEAVFLMEEWGGRRQADRRPQTLRGNGMDNETFTAAATAMAI